MYLLSLCLSILGSTVCYVFKKRQLMVNKQSLSAIWRDDMLSEAVPYFHSFVHLLSGHVTCSFLAIESQVCARPSASSFSR